MIRAIRLRRIRAKFLSSCRTLRNGRTYWERSGGIAGRILASISPIPVLGLEEEGRGLLDALEWLEQHCRTIPLSENIIRQYHTIACASLGRRAGAYRDYPIAIEGSLPRASPGRLVSLMRQLDSWLTERQQRLDVSTNLALRDVLEVAADLHQRIGLIHPFADGNGRVARIAMNHLLRRYGLGYVILPPLSESVPLWEALQAAHHGKLGPMIEFAVKCHHPV